MGANLMTVRRLKMLALLLAAFSLAACGPRDSEGTEIPATIETGTTTAASASTPVPPLGTSSPGGEFELSGTPLASWRGVPIMPGAIAGQEESETYRFTISASTQDIQTYYQGELTSMGWQVDKTGYGEGANLIISFSRDQLKLRVSMSTQGELTLVLLAFA
jgi:ABC-type amino acid transport substrate-binding protein